jgi:hypothetical protein
MPGRDPLDRKAPCPLRYTFVRVPIEYPLFFAFAAKDFRTAGERGLAALLGLGAAFLRVGFRLRTATGNSFGVANKWRRGRGRVYALRLWVPPPMSS